jgi:hypothetical protein
MLSGVVAEFETPEALEGAYEALTRQGYTRLDAWTPYPVRSLVKAGFDGSIVAWIMLVAGLAGGALGYLIQLWVNVRAFRINVGGRPLDSAPAFIPITFESAVLLSAVTGFIAMLALSRLPRLHHRCSRSRASSAPPSTASGWASTRRIRCSTRASARP